MIDDNTKNPALAIYDTVSFYVKDDSDTQQANLRISPLNLAKYLDTNDLKVKAKTPHDYVNDVSSHVASSIGFYVSLIYQNKLTVIGQTGNNLIQYSSLISAIIGVAAFLWSIATNIVKDNEFEYGGIYKRKEIRIVQERHGWGLKETGRYNETAYLLSITKPRGKGRLEECDGLITINGKLKIPVSWEGANYQKFRSISTEDNIKLFNISEGSKQIHFFGNPDSIDSVIPYLTISNELNEEVLNTKLSVSLGAKSGNPPKKPFVTTIGEIIDKL